MEVKYRLTIPLAKRLIRQYLMAEDGYTPAMRHIKILSVSPTKIEFRVGDKNTVKCLEYIVDATVSNYYSDNLVIPDITE